MQCNAMKKMQNIMVLIIVAPNMKLPVNSFPNKIFSLTIMVIASKPFTVTFSYIQRCALGQNDTIWAGVTACLPQK